MKKANCWMVLISMVSMVVVLVTCHSLVFAQDYEFARQTLHGLQGVGVLIEDPDPEIQQVGLTRTKLETDVKMRLLRAGIKMLLIREEFHREPGRPTLWVRVGSAKTEFNYYFYVIVGLIQDIELSRPPSIQTRAPTWYFSNCGLAPKERIVDFSREMVRRIIDIFISDYLSVNPK